MKFLATLMTILALTACNHAPKSQNPEVAANPETRQPANDSWQKFFVHVPFAEYLKSQNDYQMRLTDELLQKELDYRNASLRIFQLKKARREAIAYPRVTQAFDAEIADAEATMEQAGRDIMPDRKRPLVLSRKHFEEAVTISNSLCAWQKMSVNDEGLEIFDPSGKKMQIPIGWRALEAQKEDARDAREMHWYLGAPVISQDVKLNSRNKPFVIEAGNDNFRLDRESAPTGYWTGNVTMSFDRYSGGPRMVWANATYHKPIDKSFSNLWNPSENFDETHFKSRCLSQSAIIEKTKKGR